jgi:hypothetical protein
MQPPSLVTHTNDSMYVCMYVNACLLFEYRVSMLSESFHRNSNPLHCNLNYLLYLDGKN